MKIKMILPALTEAKSPFWRPIKYSLFPPLGLATLAAYLFARRRDRTAGRARRRTPRRRSTRSGRDPGLHHQRLSRVPDGRSLSRKGALRLPWRSARHFPARRSSRSCRQYISGPRRRNLPEIPPGLSRGKPERVYPPSQVAPSTVFRPFAATSSNAALSRAELHRRLPGMSSPLRFLLQRRVFRRWPRLSIPNRSTRRSPEIDRLPGRHLYFPDDHLLGQPPLCFEHCSTA